MAAPSFYQVTPVAIDMSPNTVQRTLNVSLIQDVRPATTNEIAAFSTAATAIVYGSREGNNVRLRTLLTAAAYATINTLFTA